jgi:hypothetical protein
MTHLPSSRVPLLYNQEHETSVFCCENQREDCFLASDWVFWRALQKQVLGKFDLSTYISIDRLRAKFRSIDFSGPPNFQSFPYEIFHSSLIVLQKQKTQKLTKTLENNKAKGLTSANQGVQIHNIWHSSLDIVRTCCHVVQTTCRTVSTYEIQLLV